MHPKTKETMIGNIRELYKEVPLYFYEIGVEGRPEMDMTYEELLTLMFGDGDNILHIGNKYENGALTSSLNEDYPEYWYRRSMEDLFLLAKHYVRNASISGLWNSMLTSTSSYFCTDTGLRVFRHRRWNREHLAQGWPLNGFAFSIATNYNMRRPIDSSDLGYFSSIEEFTTLLSLYDDEVRSEEGFNPIGRAYEKRPLYNDSFEDVNSVKN